MGAIGLRSDKKQSRRKLSPQSKRRTTGIATRTAKNTSTEKRRMASKGVRDGREKENQGQNHQRRRAGHRWKVEKGQNCIKKKKKKKNNTSSA